MIFDLVTLSIEMNILSTPVTMPLVSLLPLFFSVVCRAVGHDTATSAGQVVLGAGFEKHLGFGPIKGA
jgi:hypothetical protein